VWGGTNHGGEADELKNEEGADSKKGSSCFAEDVVEDLCDRLCNWTREDRSRVTLKKVSNCRLRGWQRNYVPSRSIRQW